MKNLEKSHFYFYLPALQQETAIHHSEPHHGICSLKIFQSVTPTEQKNSKTAKKFGSRCLNDRFLSLVDARLAVSDRSVIVIPVGVGVGGFLCFLLQLILSHVIFVCFPVVIARTLRLEWRYRQRQGWTNSCFRLKCRFKVVVSFQRVIRFLNVFIVI